MALLFTALFLAVSASARGITEAPAAITPGPEAPCTLTNSIPGCGVSRLPLWECRVLTLVQIPCLISAGGEAGCFNPLDLACQCKAATKIRGLASDCVRASCGPEVGSSLESVADAICTECAV